MNGWVTFGIGLAGISMVFCLAWAWARKIDNYSLVDAVWAFGIGLIGCWWLISASDFREAKHWIAALMLGLWSVRLGWHLQRRIRHSYPEEDARYGKLRETWKGKVAKAFFWFFQAQALSAALLALPFLLIAADPNSSWSAWESAGLVLALVGISGEALADSQMSRFKSLNSDKKAICREGFWRFSRHPNYFFESVIWIGFYIYACGSHSGWSMIYAPAIIIFLLVKVTGIPPTEASALARKGDAYREYQETTSPLIPWPPLRRKTKISPESK